MTRARARSHRGRDVARAADAAVGDQRHAGLACRAGAVEHRRQLRHTDARRRVASCRRSPGPIPTLTASAPAAARSATPSPVATLPATTSTSGHAAFSSCTASIAASAWPCAMSSTSASTSASISASERIEVVAADPDRGRDPQPAEVVARGAGVAVGEREVAERDEPRHSVVRVDERELLDAVRGEEAPRLLELDPGCAGDEPLARRHQLVDAVGRRRPRACRARSGGRAAVAPDRRRRSPSPGGGAASARACATVRSGSITYGSPTTWVR